MFHRGASIIGPIITGVRCPRCFAAARTRGSGRRITMKGVEHRVPPQNLDAEQGVLRSVMLDSEAFPAVEGILAPEHVYRESHRKIYRAMERLFRQGDPIDLIALGEELRRTGELEGIGNFPYLVGLMDMVPTAAYEIRRASCQ